jgi:accessory gene regulator protein AgrB
MAILGILSKRNSEEKCVQQSEEVVFEVGYFVFNIVLFIFQMLLVLSICYFIKNTLINVILIYISFVILRKVFGETYHADSIIKCTTISVILFITATELSLDINISLLSCIFIGIALSYGMHVYYFYDNYIKQNNDVTKLSLDELRKKLYFLSDLEINLVYDYWHKDKHTTADDIADKYGYNKMKIYRTIKKIKNNNV